MERGVTMMTEPGPLVFGFVGEELPKGEYLHKVAVQEP